MAALLIILLFLGSSIIPVMGSLESPDGDTSFNLKMRLMMRFARMSSLSIAIVKNDSIVWYQGYGFSDRLLLQRPNKDTLYMVGSTSKTITATALMQLYENESYDFDLDDNVSEWLPFDFKNPKYPDVNITFRMLLAHQSSIYDYGLSELKYLFSYRPFSYVEEILMPYGEDYHPEYWGDYPPGTGANYSNFGFILLGYIIERMTGQSFEQYCQDQIFKPLGMKNTSFSMENLDKSNLAAPYFWIGGVYTRIPKTDFVFYDPAGGLYTTVEDLSHLFIAHQNGGVYNDVEILDNSTLDLMHTVQYPDSIPYAGVLRFGLGWSLWVNSNDEPYLIGHRGDLICYHSQMVTILPDNVSMISFYNSGAFTSYRIFFPNLSSKIMNFGAKQISNLLLEKVKEFK